LISDILDLSKIEAGKMTLYWEDCRVDELLEETRTVVEPLAARNANRFEIARRGSADVLRTDRTKLRQVLFNLLSNACKFTHEGTVTLEVEPDGADLALRVKDTGIGMTP